MRPTLSVPPLLALTLLSPATRSVTAARREPVGEAPGVVDLAELEQMRSAHHDIGRRVASRLGMRADWARTRWVPGKERGEILPLFRVTVAAACPTRQVRAVLVERLERLGWVGRITACTRELRIEGRCHGQELLLLADGATITLTIAGPSRLVGCTQVLHLISGVYEDEDDQP